MSGTIEVNQIPHYYLISELLLELVPVLLVPRKTVEQIAPVTIGLDAFFEQFDHQLAWQQLAVLHIGVNLLSKIPSFLFLLSEQIASGEMLEFIVSDEIFGLSAFAASRASQ